MRIVVLDGYPLNPGDLSWSSLEALGDLTVYDKTPPDSVLDRGAGAKALLVNKVLLDGPTMDCLPELRYVGVLSTGYDVVDVRAAKQRGIVVTNIPTYSTRSVAQMAISLLLHLTNHVAAHSDSVRSGYWSASGEWSYWLAPIHELEGLTMGIVGYGRIGRAAAGIARALGMRIIAHDAALTEADDATPLVELDELFREADVVSLHCPLTPDNQRMVDARRLALMKPTALLINTSRGPLIDEQALAEALNAGRIAGAGLDVLSKEPPAADCPLLQAKNLVVTPHVSWASRAARGRLMEIAAANVKAWIEGFPVNQVA